MTQITTARGALTVRPLRVEEAAAYRELRLEALRSHPQAFGADYEQQLGEPPGFWEERVRRGASGEHAVTYVAAAGAALAGMTGIYRDDLPKERHIGHIWGVYVRPEWRGAGVADALIAACLGWAGARGLRLAKLAVVTTNGAAIRCYLRQGFAVYGVDPEVIFYDGVYYDELLMARRLGGPRPTGG